MVKRIDSSKLMYAKTGDYIFSGHQLGYPGSAIGFIALLKGH